MAISLSRYVSITSGVGGATLVPNRTLVGRFFTANPLLPPQTFITCTTAASVASYFGYNSEEYLRAVFYFSWVSKNLTTPQSIQFARWVQTAAAPMIYPNQNNNAQYANFVGISTGSFVLTMGGSTYTLSSLDFTGIGTSLAAAAAVVQAAIQAAGSFVLVGTTNGTTLVTMASTAGLAVGMSVVAADITTGTTIASIVVNTSITLSQAATSSNASENITFNTPMWGLATVSYVANDLASGLTFGGFVLTGGAAGSVSNPINVMVGGGGTDITGAGLLGWLPQGIDINGNYIPGAIWSTGSAVETVTQTLTNSAAASNNFGSFAFLTNLGLTEQNVSDAAIWNQTQNVTYMFSQAVSIANASSSGWASLTPPGVGSVGGVGLTLSPAITTSLTGTLVSGANTVTALTSNAGLFPGMPVSGTDIPAGTVIQSLVGTTGLTLSAYASGSITTVLTFTAPQFPEMFPMMIMAATDYTAFNSVQNYEFQQVAGLTPSVTTDAQANAYDYSSGGPGINYYGLTKQAGAQIAFFQQGVLQGANISTNIVDMNVYANEVWLKDAIAVAIMNLLLAVSQIPANPQGISLLMTVIQSIINQALNNGTISVGKILNATQQAFITAETGDPTAWYQVQNSGYWYDVYLTSAGSPAVYTANYTLIYSKDDVIRKVVGTDTLI